MVIHAEEQLHGDDDEGGRLEVVLRQGGTGRSVERVERLIRHAGAFYQPADPRVELIWREAETTLRGEQEEEEDHHVFIFREPHVTAQVTFVRNSLS